MKHFSVLVIVALVSVGAALAQSEDDLRSIEQTAKSDVYEQKLLALKQIGKALEQGSTDEKIYATLEYLSLEGTQNKSTRLINSYPDVRRQSVIYLGSMKTAEAKNILIKVCRVEKESMVLTEAVRALGNIGINEDGDVVGVLVRLGTTNNASRALDNALAFYIIDTLEKIAEKYKTVDADTMQLLAKMLEGQYSPSVKKKATQAFSNMRRYVNG